MKGRAGVSAILLWPNKATGAKRKPLSGLEWVPYGGERVEKRKEGSGE